MAQFYTLEEAARVLGMSPDELKTKAQSREVRAFMDSGSWRFRVADVDELARRRGMGSDPDLSLSDMELDVPRGSGSGSEELMLSEFQLGVAKPDLAPPSLEIKSSEHDILLDESALPPNPVGGSSSVILGMGAAGKLPSDSDVRLVPDNTKGASDSDVRLGTVAKPGDSDVKIGKAKPKAGKPSDSDVKIAASRVQNLKPSDSDVTLVADESAGFGSSDELPVARPRDAKRPGSSAMIGSSAEVPAGTSDSDFELTPSSVIDALQPESGSDFELTALDASDEFDASPSRGPSDSDVTAAEPAASGINLGKPSDSGINLQTVGSFDLDSADSIELAPLDDEDAGTGKRPTSKPAPKAPAKPKKADLAATSLPGKAKADLAATSLPIKGAKADLSATSLPSKAKVDLSATSLPMKKGEKDIFEDTDFEVDAVDSGEDHTVQLEASSDFDIDESESASEVFALDEEEVDQNAATAMAPAVLDDDEGFTSGEEPVSGETPSAWDVESDATPSTVARSAAASPSPMLASAGAQAEWGGLWVGMLIASSVFILFAAFVGMDLVRNMYDLRGDIPVTSGLVKSIAGMF
jgi:hypothetical protein